MADYCAENERIKHAYFRHLRNAKQRDQATVDGAAMAIARYERATGYRPFSRFHHEQAVAFKERLLEQVNQRHGDPLSRSTMLSILNVLKAFFLWLVEQRGYRGRFPRTDVEYFNLPANDVRIAKAIRARPVPTLDQVRDVILAMPSGSGIEKRDRALIALTLLTGARDSATISFRLKHLDLEAGHIIQDAREVRTKFRKTFTTTFFPVGDEIRVIVADWIDQLRGLGFGPDDPLFPATRSEFDATGALQLALDRRHWSQTGPVRKIFRAAFDRAGLPYSNPHTIRKTLVALAFKLKLPPEEMKAWSQNLGHEQMLTTYLNYGEVPAERQREILQNLADRSAPDLEADALARRLIEVARSGRR